MVTNHFKTPIFLDYQSTTPTDPRAVEKMLPWFTEKFGNPHSADHQHGWDGAEAIDSARDQIAHLIGAKGREVIFTSGATESNNLAIKGVARARRRIDGRCKIITLETEHKCVLESVSRLGREGFDVIFLPVNPDGLVDLDRLATTVDNKTSIVSIMGVNNEIGVIQPLAEIGAICKNKGALFHSDCAQAVGKISVDVKAMNIDLMSISAHKLYGPKGIGALYITKNPRIAIDPIVDGGGQEKGLRSGTLAPSLCVGFGVACALAGEEMLTEANRLKELRDIFLNQLQAEITGVIVNGSLSHRIAGNINLTFNAIETTELMAALDGLSISSGSACSSGSDNYSHVLRALGHDPKLVSASLRIGFGRFTTADEMSIAKNQLVDALKRLRNS